MKNVLDQINNNTYSIKNKWWQEAIGYQIYIRSFKDSNNDGIGDLKGIIEKLDYLHDLGINLIWICPFYASPMDDNGYDVSDFYDVSTDYGSKEDIKRLIIEAHKLDIKVMMDLILNHTSDEHKWFQEAKKSKDNPYHDYYIWQNPRYIDNKRVEPTNWASFFGGSCWEYDSNIDQYYMKIFSKKMPDLNWKNPNVQKEMIKVAESWCKIGIDGFRIDAIAHLGKDEFIDSEMIDKNPYKPDWKKYSNLPIVHDYLKILNKEVFSKYNIVTIGEVGGNATVDDAIAYTQPAERELDMVFNFDHNWCNNKWTKKKDEKLAINVPHLKEMFNKWQTGLYQKSWNAIYWLNHDQPRVISHYGDRDYFFTSGKMLAICLYFMWGTPFIYNGEEIGMTNPDFKTIDDFRDVSIKTIYNINVVKNKQPLEEFISDVSYSTRDNARTIMQWDDTINAGFSKVQPWNILCNNYKEINVERQINDPNSLLSFYKRIIKIRLRSEYKDVIIYGNYQQLYIDNPSLYVYTREYNDKKILVICNLTDKIVVNPINEFNVKEIILSNYERKVILKQFAPFESIVLSVCL